MRDGEDKLIRRSYWLDMDDRSLVLAMTQGIGANLTNEEKRAHFMDLAPGAPHQPGLHSGSAAA
jgi:hypothetical protein